MGCFFDWADEQLTFFFGPRCICRFWSVLGAGYKELGCAVRAQLKGVARTA